MLDPAVVERLMPQGSFYRFLHDNVVALATEDVVAGLFSDDTGRPSSLAPEHYLALVLLRYHDDVSYEVAAERGQFDVRWKAVLGKDPMDLTPTASASSLQEFEDALRLRGRHEVLLQRTIRMARDAGLLSERVTAAQDSTSVIGRGAVKDTYNLLGDGLRRLLRAVAKSRGVKPLALAEQYGVGELFRRSTKASANIDWSSPDARRGFLRRLVETAEALMNEAARDSDGAIGVAIEILRKVIAQDIERGTGGAVSLRIGVAPDRLIAIHEPEMRRGHKSQSEPFEGYKSHFTVDVTSGIVMATTVTGANVHDAVPSASMAAKAERASNCVISKIVGDAAYGTEANRVEHASVGRMLVTKLPRPRCGKQFTKSDFMVDLEQLSVTCPGGATTERYSTIRRRREQGEDPADVGTMRRFSFQRATCVDCEFKQRCLPAGQSKRRVDVGHNEHLLQAARRYASEPQYEVDRRSRQIVERTIARVVQLGARQARERGRDKVEARITLIVVVANLTRMLSLANHGDSRSTNLQASA